MDTFTSCSKQWTSSGKKFFQNGNWRGGEKKILFFWRNNFDIYIFAIYIDSIFFEKNLKVAKLLIKRGSNLNTIATFDITPLHAAVIGGHKVFGVKFEFDWYIQSFESKIFQFFSK